MKNLEQVGLQIDFSAEQRQYFDQLMTEFRALFGDRKYEEFVADEDTSKLRQISQKLAQIEDFVKTKRIEIDPSRLKFIGTIEVPGAPEGFRVIERFALSVSATSERVCLGYICDDFRDSFGDLVVPPSLGAKLSSYSLEQRLSDQEIISTFGGEERVVTSLAIVWGLLEKQKNGEAGVLQTNSRANVFYVRDRNKVLRAVGLYWNKNTFSWEVWSTALGRANWTVSQSIFFVNA